MDTNDMQGEQLALPPSPTRGERIRARASGLADRADRMADSASTRVGTGLTGSAERVRSSADSIAHGLERAGSYLERSTGRELMGDLTEVMRRHPRATIGVGLGLGFLVARMLRR